MTTPTVDLARAAGGDAETDALAILGAFAERVSPADALAERTAAARALLASLLRLSGRVVGVAVREAEGGVAVGIGGREALVSLSEADGTVEVRRLSRDDEREPGERVRLRYDRVQHRFFGWEDGRPPTDGLAAVAHAVTSLLGSRDREF